jgi:hypothetical protein
MSTGMYQERVKFSRPLYHERDLLLAERFYPGEFGWVVVLGVASLLVYSLAIWGLLSETSSTLSMNMGTYAYGTSDYSYNLNDTTTTTPGSAY